MCRWVRRNPEIPYAVVNSGVATGTLAVIKETTPLLEGLSRQPTIVATLGYAGLGVVVGATQMYTAIRVERQIQKCKAK